jgi:hypothetical protein
VKFCDINFCVKPCSVAKAERINVITKHEEEKQDRDVASRDSLSSDWDSEDDSLPLDKLETKVSMLSNSFCSCVF